MTNAILCLVFRQVTLFSENLDRQQKGTLGNSQCIRLLWLEDLSRIGSRPLDDERYQSLLYYIAQDEAIICRKQGYCLWLIMLKMEV